MFFRKVFDKQQEELRTKSLQLLAEEEKVMTATAKLYSTERMLESLRAQNYKLQVQVEELRLKYEPGKAYTMLTIRTKEQWFTYSLQNTFVYTCLLVTH